MKTQFTDEHYKHIQAQVELRNRRATLKKIGEELLGKDGDIKQRLGKQSRKKG